MVDNELRFFGIGSAIMDLGNNFKKS